MDNEAVSKAKEAYSRHIEPVEERIKELTDRYSKVADSGKRQEFPTGSVRDTREGKGRYDLIAPYALQRLAQHYENGSRKYGDRNWEKGQNLSRYLDSAARHLFKYLGGSREEDHLAAVAWNVFSYIQTEQWIKEGRLPFALDDVTVANGIEPNTTETTQAKTARLAYKAMSDKIKSSDEVGTLRLITKCCGADYIIHHSDEGTGYYSCVKCGKACDLTTTPVKVV